MSSEVIIFIVCGFLFGLLLLIFVPKVQVWSIKDETFSLKDKVDLANKTRTTLATIIGGLIVIGSLAQGMREYGLNRDFNTKQLEATTKQIDLARDQIASARDQIGLNREEINRLSDRDNAEFSLRRNEFKHQKKYDSLYRISRNQELTLIRQQQENQFEDLKNQYQLQSRNLNLLETQTELSRKSVNSKIFADATNQFNGNVINELSAIHSLGFLALSDSEFRAPVLSVLKNYIDTKASTKAYSKIIYKENKYTDEYLQLQSWLDQQETGSNFAEFQAKKNLPVVNEIRKLSFSAPKDSTLILKEQALLKYGLIRKYVSELDSAYFENIDLSNLSIVGADFKNVTFRECIFVNTEFIRCDLTNAVFQRCIITPFNFQNSKLDSAIFYQNIYYDVLSEYTTHIIPRLFLANFGIYPDRGENVDSIANLEAKVRSISAKIQSTR